MKIRRALISVSDKNGLLPLVEGLRRWKVEILSTGGTAKFLRENGIPVRQIADFTGFPEILEGRVKTLHPQVHGGILARRKSALDRRQAEKLGLQWIDLVVVNLYPFEATAQKKGVSLEALIEQIDIGGVALIRSAAKNFESVGVVTRQDQYAQVLEDLQKTQGQLSEKLRLELAVLAFQETAYYDSLIHQALAHRAAPVREFPDKMVFAVKRLQTLRYGENPHQQGSWYRWSSNADKAGGLGRAKQLNGKELSFNNLLDLDAAISLVSAFDRPAAAVIKHMNPCGVAFGKTLEQAFRRAFAGDPLSAFGGIVGLNRPVDVQTAKAIAQSGFLECLIAPRFAAGALAILKAKKNLRILELPGSVSLNNRCLEIKQISGGLLIQDPDRFQKRFAQWRLVTAKKPTPSQKRDLIFAWTIAKFVRSNAIVVVKGEQTVGIGAGQTSRVDSVEFALKKAGPRARGAVLASDGFFPRPDGPQKAIRAGIRAIVQPGGSIQDPQVIRVAQQAKIPMFLTGERHFKH